MLILIYFIFFFKYLFTHLFSFVFMQISFSPNTDKQITILLLNDKGHHQEDLLQIDYIAENLSNIINLKYITGMKNI